MATSSNPTVESSVRGNLQVLQVLEHKRTQEIWDHYDLCEMSNGSKRARCKYCHKFFVPETNSMLKAHIIKACKRLNSPPSEQATIYNEEVDLGILPPPKEDENDDE